MARNIIPFEKKRIDSVSELVKMFFLIALAASVAADNVKIGELKTLQHGVITDN